MIKFYYLLQNSIKNLIRSSGILLSYLLICLSSFLSGCFLNVGLFFSHWHNYSIEEATGQGIVGIMGLTSPSGMLTTIFKSISIFIATMLILSTLSAVRRLFFQMANDQRPSFQTMSLVGETTEFISLDFALQSIYVTLTTLFIGITSANIIFINLLNHSLAFGPFEKIVADFKINTGFHLLIILSSCLYIGCRVFFFVRRYLHSFFDNFITLEDT